MEFIPKTLWHFAVALALGLLIGTERTWEQPHRSRSVMFGMRTMGLIGLLGALWAYIGQAAGNVLIAVGYIVFGALIAAILFFREGKKQHAGATTIVAVMLTYGLGTLSMYGFITEAVAIGVAATVLLSLKEQLHTFVSRISEKELIASLKLLIIALIILPLLPNEGFGPWKVFNPYTIWWMVVLITGLSYIGYVGMRIFSARTGMFLTAFLGGLVSSTAVTLSFARRGRTNRDLHKLLSGGILIAGGTMFPRILIEVSVIHHPLLEKLILPLLAMALVFWLTAIFFFFKKDPNTDSSVSQLKNPFELKVALQFTAFLVIILFLSRFLKETLGSPGIYLLSFLSGLTDVDAITLSLAQMAANDGDANTLTTGIFIAAATNTLVKAGIAAFIARGQMAFLVGIASLVAVSLGTVLVFFL